MIDHEHALPVTHQAELLQISRSSLYYAEKPVSAADLELMREIEVCIWIIPLRRRTHVA